MILTVSKTEVNGYLKRINEIRDKVSIKSIGDNKLVIILKMPLFSPSFTLSDPYIDDGQLILKASPEKVVLSVMKVVLGLKPEFKKYLSSEKNKIIASIPSTITQRTDIKEIYFAADEIKVDLQLVL